MSQMKNFARMEWIKSWAFDRPVIFSTLVILISVLFTEIPLNMLWRPFVGSPAAQFLEGIIEQGLAGLILMGLLVKLGLFQKARFTPPRQWQALWLAWPLVVMTLLNVSPLLDGSLVIDTSRPGLIVLYIGLVLSIGFFEEILGRGVALTVMLQKWGSTRRGIYQAVLVSSALFGVAHLINVLAGRLPLLSTLTQIVYGFFFAVIFAACVLRNNSIWPMVIMHAAFDFGGRLLQEIAVGGGSATAPANSTLEGAVITFMLTLPLFLYGMFILRKVSPAEPSGSMMRPRILQTEVSHLSPEC